MQYDIYSEIGYTAVDLYRQ